MTPLRDSGYGPPAPVPVFQRAWEFTQLLDLYKQKQPRKVLEVGTYHGGTLYHWLTNAAPQAVIVTVDTYAAGVDNRHLYKDWTKKGTTLVVVKGDSRHPKTVDLVRKYAPYQWVFIDADHYEPAVRDDWRNYSSMVDKGVIAFHDILTHPDHPEIEVQRLWDELKQTHETEEFVASPANNWGGIGVVHL